MRKYIIACTIAYFIFSAFIIINMNYSTTYQEMPDGVRIMSHVTGQNIEINRFGRWQKTYIKGVDVGAAKPGSYPGDFAITKNEYYRWFKQIADMNANTIRVYTILSPEFYEALKSYNENNLKKLYLIQGVWVNEEDMINQANAFSPVIQERFMAETMQAVDVIHGNAEIQQVTGKANGTYHDDVSKWVIGYILGIEWDGSFVSNTNKMNASLPDFKGNYFETKNAEPFEIFLAQVGDSAVAYESQKYKQQRMVAFSNWPTTDPLLHSNEEASINLGSIDVEHVKATDHFYSGQFASYHVYPYYPDFLSFQKDYQKPFPDGEINPYRAYLEALVSHHRMPVMISEYGVPSSRGIARRQEADGYDQGHLSEKEQGKILADLTNIIYDSGCAGGLIFSWQDEWFKRTWNTMDYSLPDYRAFWSDFQTNEQSFGLLTFDPGRKKTICSVDGKPSEWSKDDVLLQQDDMTLSVKYDEKFIYFRINKPDLDFDRDKLMIPIDITGKSGIKKSEKYNASFDRPADFMIWINGKEDSAMLAHQYFDVFTFDYAMGMFRKDPYSLRLEKDKGEFTDIYMAMRYPMRIEATGEYSKPDYFNTGKLLYGNTDPESNAFNSIADFCAGENDIEIRIPWALLNIMDPSSKKVMDDFYSVKGIKPQSYEKIYFGILKEGSGETAAMVPFEYPPWTEPDYHERLKGSYPYVKDVFEDIGRREVNE